MHCRTFFQGLLFCFLIFTLVGCDQNPQRNAGEQAKGSRGIAAKMLGEATIQAFAEFKKKYNADDTWPESFRRNPVWTMEVQDHLIPADGRPILSAGNLHDVKRQGSEYLLHFKKADFQRDRGRYLEGHLDIDFVLKCGLPEDKRTEYKDANERSTASLGRKIYDEYAFVARIHTVERSDKPIEQVGTFPHFIATGECLEMKYIGETQDESSKSTVLPRRPGETPEQYLKRTKP